MSDTPKVKLALSTWIALCGVVLSVAIAGAGLASYIFQSKAAAAVHEGDFRAHVSESKGVFRSHGERLDKAEDIQVQSAAIQQNIRENLIILMEREGHRRRVKPLPAGLDAPFEDIE